MTFRLPKKIKIKQEHIHNGTQKCSATCPIALAFSEALGWDDCADDMVQVSETDISFFISGTCRWSVPFDDEIRRWVDGFDFSKEVEPISLTLEETLLEEEYYAIDG